ncbi:hypothetical protein V8C37DRAFT_416189 [Trichoderma ceciliae]
MVVSAVTQPRDTYLLWKRFSYPSENGPKKAYAVPTWVANQLNSAYSIMLTLLMVEIWTIIIAIVLFYLLRWQRRRKETNSFHPLVPILWNNRGALDGSFMETFKYAKDDGVHLWMVGILFLVLAAWIAQTAVSIIVPPMIILNNTAPVDPTAIYIPINGNLGYSKLAARYVLEAPSALRAVGSTDFAKDIVDQRVAVSSEEVGKTSDGESILRINYGYHVTGADFGLQKYPELRLDVNGSCITEYGWVGVPVDTNITGPQGTSRVVVDSYKFFQFSTTASLYDGRQPIAHFYTANITLKGALEKSNATWAAIISSIGRISFSPGGDPWYLTEQQNSSTGAAYVVRGQRPGLSCWEDDVWSYKGHKSTLTGLNSDHLPGLGLSVGMQGIFAARLGTPMIQNIGSHLGLSALLSASTALDQIFDASTSSILSDLQRLVQAAFIATSNILTDTTLYPADASTQLDNVVEGEDGIGDFVVWSSDASALSVKVIIIIPSLLAGVWLLTTLLLLFTPIQLVNGLDSSNMFEFIKLRHPTFGPAHDKSNGVVWKE